MVWTARVCAVRQTLPQGLMVWTGTVGSPGGVGRRLPRRAPASAGQLAAAVEITCAQPEGTDDSAFWQKPKAYRGLTSYTGTGVRPSTLALEHRFVI